MASLPFSPSLLTLGTAQLGLPYGLANRSGMPDEKDAFAVMSAAFSAGATIFDTARAYGLSEERIGRWLAERKARVAIVTKFSSIPEQGDAAGAVSRSLEASARALGRDRLDLVLAHRGENLLERNVVGALEGILCGGQIGAFGASVYAPDVALRLLDSVPVAALQVPLSVVDRRFVERRVLERAASLGVTIFARSVFLQGALLIEADLLPPHLAQLASVIRALRKLAADWGLPLAELAVMAVRDTPGVTSTVIGVEQAEQLAPHVRAARRPPLTSSQQEALRRLVGVLPEAVLDPSQWPR